MGLFDKIFNRKSEAKKTETKEPLVDSNTRISTGSKTDAGSDIVIKHNVCDTVISQYSSLPRYYYIHGICYDIDFPESVSNIPICETLFNINGENWGMDTVLREHVNRYYSYLPDELRSACYSKISVLNENGYHIESEAEKEALRKQQKELETEQDKLKQITNSDMEQFTDIPYDLTGELQLKHRGLYLEFNEKDNDIFLSEISSMNELISKGCSLFSDTLPKDLGLSDLKKPVFKCTPYTNTGKLSKYPVSLLASSLSDMESNLYYEKHGTFPDQCGCELFYLISGSIGKADIYFRKGTIQYYFYFLRKKEELLLSKIESTDITTGIKNSLYKQ